MDLVALLTVFTITWSWTLVLARPIDSDSDTNESDEFILKFPTDVKHGFTVTINGTLNRNHTTLTAIIPTANKNDGEDCTIVFNFENKTFEVTPREDESDVSVYDFTETEDPKFSLKFEANVANEIYVFMPSFEAYDGGKSWFPPCRTGEFQHYNQIIFKEGVRSIDKLLFEFNKNST